jgi:hypothetical protein
MGSLGGKYWSNGQLFGWGLGGALGGLLTGVLAAVLLGLTADSGVVQWTSIITDGTSGVLGGFTAGALGYAFAFWFDEPIKMKSFEFRSSFLFGVVFTLLISSVLVILALSLLRPESPHGGRTFEVAEIIFIITAVGAFAAAGIKGVINNLRVESDYSEKKVYPYK